MHTHFDVECRDKSSCNLRLQHPWKGEDYLGVCANVDWDDEFLLPLYLALSQNCIMRDCNIVFWNVHNGVEPLEWLDEWNCYPAIRLGSEASSSEVARKLYRESIYHKENPEKYIDHSPLYSCFWTAVLSADKSWGLYGDMDYNTHLFFHEKHLEVFNAEATRLKNLGISEMIIFEQRNIG